MARLAAKAAARQLAQRQAEAAAQAFAQRIAEEEALREARLALELAAVPATVEARIESAISQGESPVLREAMDIRFIPGSVVPSSFSDYLILQNFNHYGMGLNPGFPFSARHSLIVFTIPSGESSADFFG